jgi:hypothetical protein
MKKGLISGLLACAIVIASSVQAVTVKALTVNVDPIQGSGGIQTSEPFIIEPPKGAEYYTNPQEPRSFEDQTIVELATALYIYRYVTLDGITRGELTAYINNEFKMYTDEELKLNDPSGFLLDLRYGNVKKWALEEVIKSTEGAETNANK